MNVHPYFQNWQPDVVIYHDPCTDGFAAAWAVFSRWGDVPRYYPTNYGKPPPDVTGQNVLIVDFSYKRPVIEEMAKTAKHIVILDHHKTAQEDLVSFPQPLNIYDEFYAEKVFALFDMDKSGARLAWEFCNDRQPVPPLITFVEDRDLWRFKHSDTRAFILWLTAQDQTFQRWTDIEIEMAEPSTYRTVMREAHAIERYYDQRVANIVSEARIEVLFGIEVPVVNCNFAFASDVGNQLLKAYPAAAFSATYCDDKNGDRKYSLRSEDGRADVSALAKKNGGGGHRNAAGFTMERKYV